MKRSWMTKESGGDVWGGEIYAALSGLSFLGRGPRASLRFALGYYILRFQRSAVEVELDPLNILHGCHYRAGMNL